MVSQSPYEFIFSQIYMQTNLVDQQLSSPQLQEFIRLQATSVNPKEPIANYTDVDISFSYKLHRAQHDFEGMVSQSPYEFIFSQIYMQTNLVDQQLSSPQLQEFIRLSNEKFDLVLLEEIFYLSYNGLIHHVGSPPVIAIKPFQFFWPTPDSFAVPDFPSYVPNILLNFGDNMSFFERLKNTFIWLYIRLDIQEFMDAAADGVIYINFGSNIHSSRLPKEKVQAFLDAFSQLPQKVLWKWESDVLPVDTPKIKFKKKNVKRYSNYSKDYLQNPVEKAIWWIEYVLRHKGAKHLRTAAVDMTWYQYFLLDVIAFLLLSFVVIILFFIFIIRTMYCCFYIDIMKIKRII
ncbi:hypothetical protein C0J52_27738 [Blattella germanica]|nr:hypothetical protein C0J52_27738 [Blattella germanica]